jgi:pyruvate/2-oxoglutarate dehydrogenase complex dihydrolipoamide acyltransferase (E2) component
MVFVGTIKQADQKTLNQITEEMRTLSAATTENDKRLRDFIAFIHVVPGFIRRTILRLKNWFPLLWWKYRGSTITLTSVGKYGVDNVLATSGWTITFAFGSVKERPIAIHGQIRSCPTTMLSLKFDRRIVSGASAAKLLNRVKDILETADFAENAEDVPQTNDRSHQNSSGHQVRKYLHA